MPSPKRPQRARRETRNEAVVEHTSPSRPSKRRKKNEEVAEAPEVTVEPADEGDSSHVADQSTSPMSDEELIMRVARSLQSSAQPNQIVQASRDHSNLLHQDNKEGVQAYAKLAASDWTYFIRQLKVNIGRCPDPPSAPAPAPAEPQGNSDQPVADDSAVHVDLGPSKMISRLHAVINFDGDGEAWKLTVKGRNALKVDGHPWRNGQSGVLKSGEVIEIGGAEMMFVLPVELSPLRIHKLYLERAGIVTPEPAPLRPARHPLPSGDGLHSSSPHKTARGHSAQKPLAPAPPDYKRPGTPPSVRRTGLVSKAPHVDSTPGPILMTNSDVDLSLDENAHIKPQYSYAQLITQAIISTPDNKCTLAGIYNFITTKYAYYRHQPASGWQNSIRHNLSLHKAFEKVARHSDEPGKGMKWQLVAENREEMIKQVWRVGRGGHRGTSSNPSSPSSAQLNYITSGPRDIAAARDPVSSARKRKVSPSGSPQPRSVLQRTEQAAHSTPVRATRKPLPDEPGKDIDGSPLPRVARKPPVSSTLGMVENAPGSPTLTSSYNTHEDHLSQFVTPAPPRVHPRLAPPSTAQRPSQHMPTSSPAPFWKYADFGSTPLRPLGGFEAGSPTKGAAVGSIGADGRGELGPQVASSPPPVRAERSKSPMGVPQSPTRRGGSVGAIGGEEGEDGAEMPEEEGFDLTKGFQSISSFHATVVKPGSNGESQSQSTNVNGDPETQESV
ncbi:putative fork head protein 1 [Triangularia verruculosa]|uniref:Fork head protein 1 n=1 Tax=Triangularia verruculosa TaxID=2587418 RepID=A0AAN7AQM9_9PEZI|nr:putative fork head protein 1 [Triangularia verruculosa]